MFDNNFIISSSDCQVEFFSEVSERSELEKKFQPKKDFSLVLAGSYNRLGKFAKSGRVADCGTLLEFRHAETAPGSGVFEKHGQLHNANFCRDRLCPMCSWRRSLKIFGQCSQIMDVISSQYDFIFATFTIPSISSNLLSEGLDKLMRGWDRLCKRKRVKTALKGFYRALEVTRNNNSGSKFYGLYHPHFHCVFAVNKSYFVKSDYINHSEWLQLWRDCFGDQSITQVDVRRFKPKDDNSSIGSAVAEAVKYSVKSSDYLFPDNPALTDEVVGTVSSALAGRRLVSFGGCFRKAWQQLNLDDPEEGDLINLDGKINPQLLYLITRFGWSVGCYKLMDYYYLENGQPVFDKN